VATALVVLGVALTCAWGVAAWQLPSRDRHGLTRWLTTLALSLGWLTLLLFGLLLARPGRSPFAWAFAGCVALALAGLALAIRGAPPRRHEDAAPGRAGPLEVALGLVVASGIAGALLNAVAWPFEPGDALAVYAPMSRQVFEQWILPSGDSLYEAYPQLVPFAYAFAHWSVGAPTESLARLVAALMAAGAVGAAGALGRAMGSARTGLAAAALVVLTPVFGRWASSGYTDIPGGFFLTLSALFAWRWRSEGGRRAALLAGLAAGLAMWTRNSTLVLACTLPLVVTMRWLELRRSASPASASIRWDAAAMLGAAAVVAAPWYLRNAIVFGMVVPPTVWTDRARHALETLALMLRGDQHFGVPGWLFTAALVHAVARWRTRDPARAGQHGVLLAFALPYVAAWWWLASYETRFLVTIVPIFAVMAALMLSDLARVLESAVPARWWRAAPLLAAASALALLPVSLRKTIEHKGELLRYTRLDDAGRHRVRIGDLYELAGLLNALPPGSRVIGVPTMIRYHLDAARLRHVDWASAATLSPDRAPLYDFAVWRPGDGPVPAWLARRPAVLRTSRGHAVYALGSAPSDERITRELHE
jgi:hypothetical protein